MSKIAKSFGRVFVLVSGLIPGVAIAGSAVLNGAGASFPYPIYAQWAYKYGQTTGVNLNYQSIGSGGGIAQVKAKTVDFGASDAPLKAEELDQAGLLQFPMVIGGVVPVLNLKGVKSGELCLTGPILADIFLGKIKKWNDPALKALNQKTALPALDITVVHRADGSGTTWIFTNYLAKVSREWQAKVGSDKSVAWPAGIGGKGNEGVAAYVQRVNGAIGYVEFAYAFENQIPFALLQNQAGKFVSPSIATFQASAENAAWEKAPGFYMVLTDQPGADSWPITGASFILIYKNQPDPAKAREMLKFFDWSCKFGQDMAKKLFYVPLPKKVVDLVEKKWTEQIKASGKPVWP